MIATMWTFKLWSVVLCCQLSMVLGAVVRNTSTFNNIDFAGRGYDVLFGNPLSTSGIDPGYRLPIFNFSVNADSTQMSFDQQYMLPAGVHAYESVSCRLDWATSVFSTLSTYMNNLQVGAKVSGNYNGVVVKGSFSASADYKSVRNSLKQGTSAFAQSSASCGVYTVDLLQNSLPPLHAYFVSEVQRVLAAGPSDKTVFMSLISQFGTHFPTSTTMGARFGQQSEMKSSILNEQSLSSIKMSAEVSVSTAVGGATASAMYAEDVERADSFSSNCTNQAIFTTGSAPAPDGNALSWAAQTFQTPAPIASSGYLPITALFTMSNIPNTDQGRLDKLVSAINQYVTVTNSYCKEFGSDCDGIDQKDDRCFGGWFANPEIMGTNLDNVFIGRQGCPAGFIAVQGGPVWYCLNNDLTQCYANGAAVSTFGGMYQSTGGCSTINPFTGKMSCPDGMDGIVVFRSYPQSDQSCDAIMCLPRPDSNGVVPASIIGGAYRVPKGDKGVTTQSLNQWPSNVRPQLPLCPLGYKKFLWAVYNAGSNMDGDWYLCLLTTIPFFQKFQL